MFIFDKSTSLRFADLSHATKVNIERKTEVESNIEGEEEKGVFLSSGFIGVKCAKWICR